MAFCRRDSFTAPGSGAGLRLQERDATPDEAYVLRVWPSRLYAVPVAIFTFLWLRFLWRWYALLLIGSGLSAHHHSRGFFVLFGLPFLFAGVSLIGTSLRLCFGRTTIIVDALRVAVRDGFTARARASYAPLVLPSVSIVDFVAECSVSEDDDDEREIDAWQVRARLAAGGLVTLPLPVRSLAEAADVAARLNRALEAARAPRGYRDSAATSSSDGSTSPLGASIT